MKEFDTVEPHSGAPHIYSANSFSYQRGITVGSGRDTIINNYGAQNTAASNILAKMAGVNQMAIQKATAEQLAPGTCSWVFERPGFDTWISKGSGIIWGVGIPGAGKTFLTSFIVNYLQDQAHQRAGSIVLFAYCRYNDDLSVSNILASFLQQLVSNSELARGFVDDLLLENGEEKAWVTQSELQAAIRTAVTTSETVFLILDALDELRDSVREEILAFLVSLSKPLFVTSRELHLSSLPSTNIIRIIAPKSDIEKFVSYKVQHFPKLKLLLENRTEVIAEVVDHIHLKSDGMFILSALQVSALGGITTIKTLRRAIHHLPTTLWDVYERTLSRIKSQSEEERSLALRAILWIIYAERPLKPSELLAALAVDVDSIELDSDAFTDERILVSACCGLITIDGDTGVHLTHYTAREFFMNLRQDPFDDPHTFVATICAIYRDLTGVDSKKELSHISLKELTQSLYPFAEYAFHNLGFHTYQSTLSHEGRIPKQVQQFLSSQSSVFMGVPQPILSSVDPNFDRCRSVHFAAYHGLQRWFDEHSQPTSTLDQLSDDKITPLSYACSGGHISVVQFLLKTGAATEINAQDKKGRSALHRACLHGHTDIVQCLCSQPNIDANLHSELYNGPAPFCGDGWTPLHCASYGGHTQSVQLLLESFPDLNIYAQTELNDWGRPEHLTARQIAIYMGHTEVVQLLEPATVQTLCGAQLPLPCQQSLAINDQPDSFPIADQPSGLVLSETQADFPDSESRYPYHEVISSLQSNMLGAEDTARFLENNKQRIIAHIGQALLSMGYDGQYFIQTGFNEELLERGIEQPEIFLILEKDLLHADLTTLSPIFSPYSAAVYTPSQAYLLPLPLNGCGVAPSSINRLDGDTPPDPSKLTSHPKQSHQPGSQAENSMVQNEAGPVDGIPQGKNGDEQTPQVDTEETHAIDDPYEKKERSLSMKLWAPLRIRSVNTIGGNSSDYTFRLETSINIKLSRNEDGADLPAELEVRDPWCFLNFTSLSMSSEARKTYSLERLHAFARITPISTMCHGLPIIQHGVADEVKHNRERHFGGKVALAVGSKGIGVNLGGAYQVISGSEETSRRWSITSHRDKLESENAVTTHSDYELTPTNGVVTLGQVLTCENFEPGPHCIFSSSSEDGRILFIRVKAFWTSLSSASAFNASPLQMRRSLIQRMMLWRRTPGNPKPFIFVNFWHEISFEMNLSKITDKLYCGYGDRPDVVDGDREEGPHPQLPAGTMEVRRWSDKAIQFSIPLRRTIIQALRCGGEEGEQIQSP